MKYLIVLAVVCCAISFSECMTAQKRFEIFKGAAEECATKEKATPEDLEVVLARKPPSSYAQKCMLTCLGERFGLISNKKVDPEGAAFLASMAFEGEGAQEHEDIARSVATACIDVTDDDRCEATFKIQECSQRVAKERGVSTGLDQ